MLRFPLSDELHLRLLEERDAAELHALVDANHDHLRPWLPWAAEQSFDDTLAFIQATRRQIGGNDGFQTAIVESDAIIGVVGFHGVDWRHGTTSIGYWLDAEHQGRGIMTRAVRALVDHALLGWSLNRVEIQTAVENRRSRAIPERLGFREEGVLREVELVGERYADGVVYAMLAGDWSS
jgi:ribosomal-protein-serine acetyltransferase